MAGAKTTVQESTISGVINAGVNNLLCEKPMGAMVLGGARERFAESINAKKTKILMDGFLCSLRSFVFKTFYYELRPEACSQIKLLKVEEITVLLEHYAVQRKKWWRVLVLGLNAFLLPAILNIFLLSLGVNSSSLGHTASLFLILLIPFSAVMLAFGDEGGLNSFDYSKLKKLYGNDQALSRAVYEALQ